MQLERTIPELLFEWTGEQEQHSLVLRFGNNQHVFPPTPLRTLEDVHRLAQQVLGLLQSWGAEQADVESMLINGILQSLDPYSALLVNDIYQEFKINTDGEFAGIGIVLELRENHLIVTTPIARSPAARAGILPYDHIIRINGEHTDNMSMARVIELLRGPPESTIVLDILRKGHPQSLVFELKRETIKLNSVDALTIPTPAGDLSYARIKNFQDSTAHELKTHLSKNPDIRGIILDLRNNPGGLLEQAIQVSDMFLPEKMMIVSVNSRNADPQSYYAHRPIVHKELTRLPLVILINHGSASASEIVSAALKNNHRAVLIGDTTFGKGSVQSVWELTPEAALKLTIAHYLTPGNLSIQTIGVTPHILMSPVTFTPLRLTPRTPVNASVIPELKPVMPNMVLQYIDSSYDATPANSDTIRLSLDELENDAYVQLAEKILATAIKLHDPQKSLLETSLAVAGDEQQRQQDLIIQALSSKDTDWSTVSEPVSRPAVSFTTELKWRPDSPEQEWQSIDKIISRQSVLQLSVSVTNKETTPIHRLLVKTESRNPAFDQLEFPVGLIGPQQTLKRQYTFSVDPELIHHFESIRFMLLNHDLKELSGTQHFLKFSIPGKPHYQMTLSGFDDGTRNSQGNSDGIIQADETTALEFKIMNKGADADNVNVSLFLRSTGSADETLEKRLEHFPHGEAQALLIKLPPHVPVQHKLQIEVATASSVGNQMRVEYAFGEKLPDAQGFEAPVISGQLMTDRQEELLLPATDEATVVLKGQLEDDSAVKDVYVMVNSKKIYYSAAQSAVKTLPFSTRIHLNSGYNQILVVGRDADFLTARQELQIWKMESPHP
ncbi:MAG: PDZ domain-containing protein [SAR324 cluster bacterium]|nr:PDZ domain-containing protein [SAR324 cluster bacterium]